MMTLPTLRTVFPSMLVVLACVGATAGCTATIEGEGPAYGEHEVVYGEGPVDVTVYPHEVYGGRDVYYVGGRWQYRSGARWAIYRREPAELARRRAAHPVRR